MWFKRKPKNRRLGREYVLDVKLRSSQVRAARTRMAAVALGVVFATVLSVFVVWRSGAYALDRLVYENSAFAIEEIDVQTDGVIAIDQLKRWAGVRVGANLLALDLARVRRDLEFVSVIQSASVERILPHTLRIRVIEREPVAQVNVPRPTANGGVEMSALYLDAEGYVILPLEPRQRSLPPNQPAQQFPIIDGLTANDLQVGRRVDLPRVQAALRLVTSFEHSTMAGLVDLQRLNVAEPEVLTLSTGQGNEIIFSLDDPEQQLRRWRDIFDMGQKLGKTIASLDLAVSNNIPARWLEASTAPVETPKPTKSSKKKHV